MINASLAFGICLLMVVEIVNAILSVLLTSTVTSTLGNVSVSQESLGRNALSVNLGSLDSMRRVVQGVISVKTKDLYVIHSMVAAFARPTLRDGIA